MRKIKALLAFQAMVALCQTGGGIAWAAYTGGEVKGGGSLSGTVKWSGNIPTEKTIKPAVDVKVCHVRADRALVIHKETLGVENAVVSLFRITVGKKFESSRVALGQKACIFEPRIVIVAAKGEVVFGNDDTVTHNIHTYSRRNRSFNLIVPPLPDKPDEAEPVVRRFVRSERIVVKCDIHSWMKAYILVSSHPYRVVTDENGRFSITDIPPGTYKVGVWHEQGYSSTRTEGVPMLEFDRKTQEVTIESGKTATVDFTAALKEESAGSGHK